MNAIAPANHWNSAGVEGFEDLDSSDFILPRWSIVQPTSKRDGAAQHLGQFVRNIDGEFRPSLDVVILKMSQSRTLWTGNLSDKHPECMSRDGKTGSVYGECARCQFNVLANAALRSDPSARRCGFGYTMTVVDDIADGSMALFGAAGTSVRPMQTFNTQLRKRNHPMFGWLIRFETERTVNDRGVFYILKPSILSQLNDDDTDMWREMRASLAGMAVRDYDEAEDGATDTVPF